MDIGKEIKDETVKTSRKVSLLWCLYSMYNDVVVVHSCLSRYLQNTNNNLQLPSVLLVQPTCFSTALLCFSAGISLYLQHPLRKRKRKPLYCEASVTCYKSHDPAAVL